MTPLDRIALVGLPAAGKSSVARALAERLGWDAVDLDDDVSSASQLTIAEIFARDGEAAFRGLEAAALERALRLPRPVVIACGGGLITQPGARRRLLDETVVVWLDADDAVLLERMGNGATRPLLADAADRRIEELRAARAAAYGSAHLHVTSSAPVAAIADRISNALRGSVRVATPSRAYTVAIRAGAVDDVPMHLPPAVRSVAIIADRTVAPITRRVTDAIERDGVGVTIIETEAGESLKTWSAAGDLLNQLSDAGVRRSDCVVALGGGTVGDVAGFVAATYLRGVAWINLPTTLLAMVDSAIGGKTGVNLNRGKNLAGAFWQPRSVICDPATLASLPDRAYRSAFGEIVKYAMIGSDDIAALLDTRMDRLLQRDIDTVTDLIAGCCRAKAAVVADDERDGGARAVLNYGHTVAHAVEAVTGFSGGIDHGEAVALGMRVAGRISERMLGCPAADIAWQDGLLGQAGLTLPQGLAPDRVLDAMQLDKKMSAAGLGWVLLVGRGDARTGQSVPDDVVRDALTSVLVA